MNPLGDMVVRIVGDNADFDSAVDQSKNKLNKMLDVAKTAGTIMSVAVTAPLIAAGVAALKSAGQMQMYQASFETMLGSTEKARAFLKELQALANVTPFTMSDLADASKTLLQFGISSESILPTLRNLGDIAQGNRDRFNQLALAFAQSQAAGRLMGQDLLQMINAGFNPLQEISKKTGQSMADLRDQMAKGTISAQDIAAAFASAAAQGGQFYDGMKKASLTLPGVMSTLSDKVQIMARSFADLLMPAVFRVVNAFGAFVDWLGSLSDGMKTLIIVIAAVAAATGPLLLAIAAVTRAVQTLSAASMFGPLGIIAAATAAAIAIAALVVHFVEARKKADEMNRAIQSSAGKTAEETQTILKNNIARAEGIAQKELDAIAEAEDTKAKLDAMNITGDLTGQINVLNQEIANHRAALGNANEAVRMATKAYNDFASQGVGPVLTKVGGGVKTWQTYRDGVEETLRTEFARISTEAQLAKQMGQAYDQTAEKQKVLQKAIEGLLAIPTNQIDEPFKITDNTIQDLIGRYNDLGEKILDVGERSVSPTAQQFVNLNDKATQFYLDQMSQMDQEIAKINQERDEFVKAGVDKVEAEQWAQGQIDKVRQSEADKEKKRQQDVLNFVTSTIYNGLINLSNSYLDTQLTNTKKGSDEYFHALNAQFRLQQLQSSINVIMNTASAIVKGYADLGPIAGTAFAIVMGAIGTAQEALILSQKLPTLAEGGIVMPTAGGRTVVAAEGGVPEGVFPLDKLGQVLSAYGFGGGDSGQPMRVVVNLNSKPILDAVGQATKDRTLLIDAGSVVS